MCYVLFSVVVMFSFFFFFKQKTAYEMRISDWSSDVCSSDLLLAAGQFGGCMIPPILQTYFFQRRHAGSLPRGPVLPTIEEGKFDILKRAGPREQVEALEAKAKIFTPEQSPLEIGRASCRERVCRY